MADQQRQTEIAEVVGFDGRERTVTLRFEFMPMVTIGDVWDVSQSRQEPEADGE